MTNGFRLFGPGSRWQRLRYRSPELLSRMAGMDGAIAGLHSF